MADFVRFVLLLGVLIRPRAREFVFVTGRKESLAAITDVAILL